LNFVFLTERYPKLSEFGSFQKSIEGKRGTTIVRNIASQFVGGIMSARRDNTVLAVMMGGSRTGSAVVTNKSTRGSSGTLWMKCKK